MQRSTSHLMLAMLMVGLAFNFSGCGSDHPPAHARLDAVEKHIKAASENQVSRNRLGNLVGRLGVPRMQASQLEDMTGPGARQQLSEGLAWLRQKPHRRLPNGDEVYTIGRGFELLVSGSSEQPRFSLDGGGQQNIIVATFDTHNATVDISLSLDKYAAIAPLFERSAITGRGSVHIVFGTRDHDSTSTTIGFPEGAALHYAGSGFEVGRRDEALVITVLADGTPSVEFSMPRLTISHAGNRAKLVVPAFCGILTAYAPSEADDVAPECQMTGFHIAGPVEVTKQNETRHFAVTPGTNGNLPTLDPELEAQLGEFFGPG